MKKIIIFLAVVLLFSCNQEEKERERLQESKASRVEEIKSKYGVKYSMTELFDFNYSYQFNPVIKSEKQLLEHYTIYDIYTIGGQNYVKLGYYKHYFDLLIGDESILKVLLNDGVDAIGYSESENFLIIKLDKIKKMDFIVDVYDDSYKGEISYIMELIEDDKFLGKGKILTIIKK